MCLPTQFSGGALVTRHQGKEVRFDWSSSAQEPMQKVSWAAFFSDVELEVLPVTGTGLAGGLTALWSWEWKAGKCICITVLFGGPKFNLIQVAGQYDGPMLQSSSC